MDGVEEAGSGADRVVVLAATNRPNSLDEALRRPGRFDREIEIGIPDPRGRRSILDAILRGIPNTLSESDVHEVAMRTHGYVGADLSALCREAGLLAIKRHSKAGKQATLAISIEDLEQAVGLIKPSTMREVMLEVPNVRWQDIGGQDEIKQKLKEAVEWPLKHPQSFLQMGITPPKGVLLYGPPGCSKTLTAKALATESGLNFIAVKGPELFSKWVGESEKAVHEIFRKARAAAPSIVFFDEIDAIAVKRGASSGSSTSVADRVLSQLLNEMDGVEPLLNVTVVAATNRPDIIDSALLRPGRIDRVLYVGPPDLASRKAIFDIQLRKMAVADDVSTVRLAEITEEFSGAEVVALCQEAAMAAMEEDLNAEKVEARHFEACRAKFKQRTTPEMLEFYRRFQEQCGLS
ncbi:AAA+-type ATPase [Spiromyces aspiralis]|uniref:AAA+-type ATPase n=1 Tax=Spiromyces aspiralis TaxID=68401 RepID=A0ACC1HE26_9FUNG|nr:AAA+-type ATPase [Spiromyces aspiralis]